jgi:hypothetical protein
MAWCEVEMYRGGRKAGSGIRTTAKEDQEQKWKEKQKRDGRNTL